MQTRDIVGFVLVPLVILIAVLFSEVRVFSSFWLVPSILWVLRLVAYALLLVGGTALLCQSTPARIPFRVVLIVWLAASGLMLLRFFWDVGTGVDLRGGLGPYGPVRVGSTEAWHYTPDLIGFTLVLLGAFLIPRIAGGRKDAEQAAAADSSRDVGS